MSIHQCDLLLGSNLGNKKNNINKCKLLIIKYIGDIIKETKIIETEPVGFTSEHLFNNQALRIHTELSPMKVLQACKKIEKEMGRSNLTQKNQRYSDRIIDIDILFYDKIDFFSPTLHIPHPENTLKRTFSIQLIKILFSI